MIEKSLHKDNPCRREVHFSMTSYELIWRLIVLLLLSNNSNESQNADKNKE